MQDIQPRGRKTPPKRIEGFIPRQKATPQPGAQPSAQRRSQPTSVPSPTVVQQPPVVTPQKKQESSTPVSKKLSLKKPRRNSKKRWYWAITIVGIGLLLAAIAASIWWYTLQLQPVNPHDTTKRTIKVVTGMTPDQIGRYLTEQGVIRNELAFTIYTRLHGIGGSLQAGEYKVAPSETMEAVVQHIVSGKSDTFSVTFFPGATLYDPTDIADGKRTDVYTILRRAGYADAEIRQALAKQYEGSLFAGKPAGTTLEGYLYGETYQFATDASVEDVLRTVFKEYEKAIKRSGIEAVAKPHNLSLYQMITLASIIQREVKDPADQRQVAQVFYSRLASGTSLGSDVTFIYAAQQQNKEPLPSFDSPYNTRIHAGLPPGPIATPGLSALEAVASPAAGDYLYFVAGDDGKTYFAHTLEEHERNVSQHCTTLCQ